MNDELINRIIEYIEGMEETFENEHGFCRELNELIERNEMPGIYYELVGLKKAQTLKE